MLRTRGDAARTMGFERVSIIWKPLWRGDWICTVDDI